MAFISTIHLPVRLIARISLAIAVFSTAAFPSPANTLPAITVQPTEGCNLMIDDVISANQAVMSVSSHVHNLFVGVLTHLSTTEQTTLGFSMAGNDTASNSSKGNVAKWQGLKSFRTFASASTSL